MTPPADRLPPRELPSQALRAEVEQLRLRNETLELAQARSGGQRAGRAARAFASLLLVVVGVLCLTAAPVAIWGRNLVLDTDRYVQTLEPVARNPGVQDAVVKAIDRQVAGQLDIRPLLNKVLPQTAVQVLAAPVQSGVQDLIARVETRFVRSDAFQRLWVSVNRSAHTQLTYLLTGTNPTHAALKVNQDNKLVLDLAPIIDAVKGQLVNAGLTIARNIPTTGATLELLDVKGFNRVRGGVNALDKSADWLPWIGLLLTVGGVVAARTRRRTTMRAALGLAAGMIVVGVGLLVGRGLYLDRISSDRLPRGTASFLFDTMVRFLRDGVRLLFLIALLVTLAAGILGPSNAARGLRRFVTVIPRRLGSRLPNSPVADFVTRNIRVLRIALLVAATGGLLLVDAPSVVTIVIVAVLACALLLSLEVLRRDPSGSRPIPS